jgi:seryl-tRNA synthetase
MADLIGTLRRRGHIERPGDGGLRFHGTAGRLYRWLDEEFERMILETGAIPLAGADTIDRDVLARAGYFESFADGAISATGEASRYLPPAACYHVYDMMQGTPLGAGRRMCITACCGRKETLADVDLARLQRFRMREAVFFGASAWVSAERDGWMDRVNTFAEALGLEPTIETATDTFFGSEGRGRRLLQQLKNLKYELRADAGSAGRLALASFNLHESFFTSRFDIGPMADGSPAVSGCVAFGIERWTLACLARYGETQVEALVERGVPRFTTNT